MEAALAVFASRQAIEGRKLLVLGDMLELGAQSAELHAGLKRAVAGAGADLVFLVGPRMQALAEALGPGRVAGWGQGVADIEGPVLNALANGDVVMIKGSNGVRLSALVARIRQEFGGDGAS
jgi:UDP-N-acetylmuramoyl-tripeptide--D-alanyl-D-alanine ligase